MSLGEWSSKHGDIVINMAQDTEPIKKLQSELSNKIVGAIEHHIRMVDVAMSNLIQHASKSKTSHRRGWCKSWDATVEL